MQCLIPSRGEIEFREHRIHHIAQIVHSRQRENLSMFEFKVVSFLSANHVPSIIYPQVLLVPTKEIDCNIPNASVKILSLWFQLV